MKQHDSFSELADFHKQGKADDDLALTNLDEIKIASINVADQALRSIYIVTPNLEPLIYDNPDLLDKLLTLCRGNRHASIRILVKDSSTAIKRGHGLIRLAQRLTTAIEVRKPMEEYLTQNLGFLLADNSAFVYRENCDMHKGISNLDCKYRGNALLELFNQAWEHSELDEQIRRLFI
ncbi:MAG: hypothetical protein ACN4GM_05925 [Gammaproteobacteria bacterium]